MERRAAGDAHLLALKALSKFEALCVMPGRDYPESSSKACAAMRDALGAMLAEAHKRIGERYKSAQRAEVRA